MDDQVLEVARMLQGEAWWLGGMIAVLWSLLCRIVGYEADGLNHAAAIDKALTKYTGRQEPGDDARWLAGYVKDPVPFLSMAAMFGYHFDLEDPLPFCMGGLVDVIPNGWPRGDEWSYSPVRKDGKIDSIHLYRVHPDEQAEQEPEPRPIPKKLELEL